MRTCHRIAIAAGVAGALGFALGALVSRPASGDTYDTWRITMVPGPDDGLVPGADEARDCRHVWVRDVCVKCSDVRYPDADERALAHFESLWQGVAAIHEWLARDSGKQPLHVEDTTSGKCDWPSVYRSVPTYTSDGTRTRFGGDAEHAIRAHQEISAATIFADAGGSGQAQPPAVTTEMIDRAVDAFAREFPAQYAACKSVDPSMSLKPMFGKILAAAIKG